MFDITKLFSGKKEKPFDELHKNFIKLRETVASLTFDITVAIDQGLDEGNTAAAADKVLKLEKERDMCSRAMERTRQAMVEAKVQQLTDEGEAAKRRLEQIKSGRLDRLQDAGMNLHKGLSALMQVAAEEPHFKALKQDIIKAINAAVAKSGEDALYPFYPACVGGKTQNFKLERKSLRTAADRTPDGIQRKAKVIVDRLLETPEERHAREAAINKQIFKDGLFPGAHSGVAATVSPYDSPPAEFVTEGD